MEAVGDDGGLEVFAVYADDFFEDRGDFFRAVFEGAGGGGFLAFGDVDGDAGGEGGEVLEGFVDRHRLSAAENALAGGEIGVLAGDEDFAGKAVFGEGLDRTTGDAVVGGDDGVEVAADFREGGVHDFLAVLGLPIEGPVFVDDLDFAGGDEGEEDVILALFEHLGVVVGGGAVETDDAGFAVFRETGGGVGGLGLADFHVVEGKVVIDQGVFDEAVVGDDGDLGLVGGFDGAAHGFAVVGDDHEDIDAAADEGFDVADLAGVVAVGGLDDDGGAEFFGGGGEGVAVALPTLFLERIEREADDGFFLRGESGRGEGEEEGESGDGAEFHGAETEGGKLGGNENDCEERERGAEGREGKAVYNRRGIVRLAQT